MGKVIEFSCFTLLLVVVVVSEFPSLSLAFSLSKFTSDIMNRWVDVWA